MIANVIHVFVGLWAGWMLLDVITGVREHHIVRRTKV